MAEKKRAPERPKTREYRVELYVDAIDENSVWVLLKQLKGIPGVAGLIEEPRVERAGPYG